MKPFTANVSNRRPNYPRQANTGYAAPRAETINLKHQTKTEFGLPYPQCLSGPVKVRGPQNSPPPLGRSTWASKLMLKKPIHESRLSKRDVRTKPRLTTSPPLPLRTPANEPTTAWQGMEKSRSFLDAVLPPGNKPWAVAT